MHIPAYEIIGAADETKPWLTMVHGMSQDRRVFSAQIPVFRQDFRLLLIDLPGHGQSGAVPGPYGLAEFAAGVLAAMDKAGVTSTYYWGTHTGSGIGLLLATRHAERFQSLVLEGADTAGTGYAVSYARSGPRQNHRPRTGSAIRQGRMVRLRGLVRGDPPESGRMPRCRALDDDRWLSGRPLAGYFSRANSPAPGRSAWGHHKARLDHQRRTATWTILSGWLMS